MKKYTNLGVIGEGHYGSVMKCVHKTTGQLVAVKKVDDTGDESLRKIIDREIQMLKFLRHDNLVSLLDVVDRRKRIYLVFEYVDHTVLDELHQSPHGLGATCSKKYVFQLLRGVEFCHRNNVVHRDIKPENILVTKLGILKLCDFGFARMIAKPGELYTDYVATRWYRAPELLVGQIQYTSAIDVWAIGCVFYEMMTGQALFPGDSDIDQLQRIVTCFGELSEQLRNIFLNNPNFTAPMMPTKSALVPLSVRAPKISKVAMDVLVNCLKMNPNERPSCRQLLAHLYFTEDGFHQKFTKKLQKKLRLEKMDGDVSASLPSLTSSTQNSSLLPSLTSPASQKTPTSTTYHRNSLLQLPSGGHGHSYMPDLHNLSCYFMPPVLPLSDKSSHRSESELEALTPPPPSIAASGSNVTTPFLPRGTPLINKRGHISLTTQPLSFASDASDPYPSGTWLYKGNSTSSVSDASETKLHPMSRSFSQTTPSSSDGL